MKNYKIRFKQIIGCTMMAAVLMSSQAYGGEWIEKEGSVWQYEEEGSAVTGWQEINEKWYYFNSQGDMETGWIKTSADSLWYYLDENGAWIEKPQITGKTAVYLLDNALKKADLYQNEEAELQYIVEYETSDYIKVTVRIEKSPDYFTGINTYQINRKSAVARPDVGDDLKLY